MALIELMPYIVYIGYNWIEWEIERMRENELECIEVDIDFSIFHFIRKHASEFAHTHPMFH